MKQEYDALLENDTWELIKRPKDKKILTNKWVFKVKMNKDGSMDKYKARLVARGFEQEAGIDYEEVFAPVARYETIRTLFAIAVEKQMQVHQMDVVTAYIQGDLQEKTYMEQPEMFVKKGEEDKVCRLRKPLYGLKQAGRAWYRKLNNYLSNLGLKNTEIDPCVYVNTKNNKLIILVIYVDDLLIAAEDIDTINDIKRSLSAKFKMRDLGHASHILGISVEREGPIGKIKLTQKKYVTDLLEKFGMSNSKSVSTPLNPNEKLTKDMGPKSENEREEMKRKPYRELVGGLIYLANGTRPDLTFATSALSRFCVDPGIAHWRAAKRVLSYLKGTLEYGITYEKTDKGMEAFVDADWASDTDDRKSYSGNVIMIANGPISWEAKKQKSVALSTMEAEYMAMSEVVKEIIYLRRLLNHMKMSSMVKSATTVFCDNQSAIKLTKNSVYHGRSKHIDIRYHFVREACENGTVKIDYLQTDSMTADIFTKSLPKIKHQRCVESLKLDESTSYK